MNGSAGSDDTQYHRFRRWGIAQMAEVSAHISSVWLIQIDEQDGWHIRGNLALCFGE